jgi:hypothetical protein
MKTRKLGMVVWLLVGAAWGMAVGGESGGRGMTPHELLVWKYPPEAPANRELYRRLRVAVEKVDKYGNNPSIEGDFFWLVRLADQINEKLAAERFAAFLAESAARQRELAEAGARLAAAREAEFETPRMSPFGTADRSLQRSFPLWSRSLNCASLGATPRLSGGSLK